MAIQPIQFVGTLFVAFSLWLFVPGEASAQKKKKNEETTEADNKYTIEAQLIVAMQEKISGNLKGAQAQLEGFTSRHPNIAAGHFQLAEVYASSNMYSMSLASYQKATELDPKNKWYWLGLAEIYDYLKMYKESKDIYKKLATQYPGEPEFALSAVSILLEQGQLDEAIDVLNKVESEIGVTESVNMEKYRLYMAQKKFQEALKELEKLQNQYPRESLYLGMSAEVYYAKGDKKKALEAYEKILAIDSNNTIIHLAIADFYQKEGELDKAFFHLEKAFQNKGVDIDKKVMILLAFLDQAKKSEVHRKEGEKLNRLLTQVHPENPKSWSIAGDYALEQFDWKTALDDFENVIELDASKYIFFKQVFELCARLEKYPQLLSYTERAEELYPMQPEVFLYKGIALTHQNDYSKAEETLRFGKELVIENRTLSASFQAALAVVFALKKDKTQSNALFEKSVQTDAGNYWVYAQYVRYGNPPQAISTADKAIALANIYPESYAAKAYVLYTQNNYSEAKRVIETSFQYGGKQIKSVVLLYADITEKLGDINKANSLRTEAQAL